MPFQLLKEIANWKLEAKLENNKRYFFHTKDTHQIESGERCYVIGRKGSGKTAICEYLKSIHAYDNFTVKLSFKNFPYNLLYEHSNSAFTYPNQYITIWKYIIYLNVAKLMIGNYNIDAKIRTCFENLFRGKLEKSLADSFKEWVGTSFNISACGIEAGIEISKEHRKNNMQLSDRVELLEDVLAKVMDGSRYIILFDELDEDYKDIGEAEKHKLYISLLTSLFKAIQDVKSLYFNHGKVLPVIFLRNDIYDFITDSDKNKWDDFRIDLNWDEPKINSLIAFRISRAINEEGVTLPFSEAWGSISTDDLIPIGNRQEKK